ncbi:hypothetical protein Agub_g15108, partial [Astrephomene gubernaculifera]
ARATMGSRSGRQASAGLLWALATAILAIAYASPEGPHPLNIAEVHGVKARSDGRHLQQTFGTSSIVPLVIDDAPCLSFNADDSALVLAPGGGFAGYATVHSNGYDSNGLSILRVNVTTMGFEGQLYFGSTNSSLDASNFRAMLSTDLPDGCPATTRP